MIAKYKFILKKSDISWQLPVSLLWAGFWREFYLFKKLPGDVTILNWSTLLVKIGNSVLQNLCSKSNSHFVLNLKHCAFWLTLEHLTEIWMRLYLVPKCFSSPFIWITNEEHQEIDPKRSFVLECHHPLPATYFIFKTVCYVFLKVKPPYFRPLLSIFG